MRGTLTHPKSTCGYVYIQAALAAKLAAEKRIGELLSQIQNQDSSHSELQAVITQLRGELAAALAALEAERRRVRCSIGFFLNREKSCLFGVDGWLVGGWDKWETMVGLMG